MTRSTPFSDPALYDAMGPGSMRSAAAVVPMVVQLLSPSSVLDFGSGTGAWLSAFEAAGVLDLQGLEGGAPDTSQLRIAVDKTRYADLEQPVDLDRRFDLVMSVEVAEHLPPAASSTLVASMARHSDAVLFSAAIPDQGGAHHRNEQWPSYWSRLFETEGFTCFDPFRRQLWDDERVEWWYRQNLLLFARNEVADRLLATGLSPGRPAHLVHPVLYERRTMEAMRERGLRESLHDLAAGLRRRVK